MPMTCVDALTAPWSPLQYSEQFESSRSRIMVFCDLDGPLIDVSQRYYKTYQLAIAQTQDYYQTQGQALRLTPLNFRQFWQLKQNRIPDPDIAYYSGLQNEQVDWFLLRVQALVNQVELLSTDCIQPGVRSALAQLRQWGAQLAVVTLRCQTQAVQILQKYNLSEWFSQIRGTQNPLAAYHNYADYKRQLLTDIIEQEHLTSQDQVWMIGDTEADVLAGQGVGIPTIALTCGIRSHTYLQQLNPTCIQSDLTTATQYLLQSAPVAA